MAVDYCGQRDMVTSNIEVYERYKVMDLTENKHINHDQTTLLGYSMETTIATDKLTWQPTCSILATKM